VVSGGVVQGNLLAGQAFEFGDELALAAQWGKAVMPVGARVGELGVGVGQQVPGDGQDGVARSILVIIWHLLSNPDARFTDLGPGYYQARTDLDRKLRHHIRQIEALLGHPITIASKAA
jgi:hypothetical protein